MNAHTLYLLTSLQYALGTKNSLISIRFFVMHGLGFRINVDICVDECAQMHDDTNNGMASGALVQELHGDQQQSDQQTEGHHIQQ